MQLHLPTRPYSLVDAINRCAAATGSVGYAMATAYADYNGHHVRVYFNGYRGYWLAEYHWGERVVLARGTFEQAIQAARREYDRGALGAGATVDAGTDEQITIARAAGFVADEELAALPVWHTPLYGLVGDALRTERQFGVPAIHTLLDATDEADYHAKLDALFQARRPRRVRDDVVGADL